MSKRHRNHHSQRPTKALFDGGLPKQALFGSWTSGTVVRHGRPLPLPHSASLLSLPSAAQQHTLSLHTHLSHPLRPPHPSHPSPHLRAMLWPNWGASTLSSPSSQPAPVRALPRQHSTELPSTHVERPRKARKLHTGSDPHRPPPPRHNTPRTTLSHTHLSTFRSSAWMGLRSSPATRRTPGTRPAASASSLTWQEETPCESAASATSPSTTAASATAHRPPRGP